MTDVLADLAAAISDGRVWLALWVAGVAVVLLVLLGVPIARRVGLLPSIAEGDTAETFGVGLSVGLVAFTTVWASVASGGRSVFVPVAVLLLSAIVVGSGRPILRFRLDRRSVRGGAVAAVFLVAIGLLYATTIAPSPRDGYQPIEFFDTAYYSVLGADLAATGVESIYSPTGFGGVAGQPAQVWYHWGELWLAAAAIDIAGVPPSLARHLIVLPILLLASAALFATLVPRIVGGGPNDFRALGVATMLFVAPIPLSLDTYFAGRARGLVFSITQYGLVVVVILLAIYVVIARRQQLASRAGVLMAGTTTAALVATHIGMATVAFAVAGAMTALAVGRVVRSRGLRIAPVLDAIRPWWRPALVAVLSIASILIWGLLTGHGVGALDPMVGIGPFDPIWGEAVFLTLLGGGVLLAAPVALPWIRRTRPLVAFLALSALLAVTAGALGWGIRVPDLNSFHLFFGAIATMLTPISVIAILILLERLRRRGRTRLGFVVLALVISQVLVSATLVVVQLQRFGPGRYPPIALETLTTFKTLPDGSKMAYSCEPFENVAPWDASLIALDAHTGVRMIPMCFFADVQRDLLERPLDERIISPYFLHAPQRALYPDADARPSPGAITAFLNANGIEYIYADATHPNSLIPDAQPVFTLDGVTVSRVPSA